MIDFKIEKKDSARVALLILFMVVTVVVGTIIAQGVDFTLENIGKPEYWIERAINLGFLVLVYNIVSSLIGYSIKRQEDGKYIASLKRFSTRVYFLKKNKEYEQLKKAVNIYNLELKELAYTAKLKRISNRLTYADIEKYDLSKNAYLLEPKTLKRLRKLQRQYQDGSLRYGELKEEYILSDKSADTSVQLKGDMSFSGGMLKLTANIIVTASFLLMGMFLSIIVFKYGSQGIVQTILNQLFLFLNATFTAFMHSNMIIGATIANYHQKADFCERFNLGKETE